MIIQAIYNKQLLKKYLVVLLLSCVATNLLSQKLTADSLSKKLKKEKIDTNKVSLMWQIADATYKDNPDTALQIAQNALYLAKSINYTEGQSRSLGILANAFMMIGNYPRALDLNFQKLQLEEKRDRPRNLASVLMNIGIIYRFQEEYSNALHYYSKADSVIRKNNVEVFKCNIALNIGDAYDRLEVFDSTLFQTLGQNDSAGDYANISLSIGKKDGFLSSEYEAAEFLTSHYKKIMNIDSAFAYAEYSHRLNDSLNSKAKIRELQILSTNEQFRQRGLEEERKIAATRRYQQLQFLLIGIFIPALFLITLLLAVLIPLHHRTEGWLIERLIRHRVFRGQTKKLHKPIYPE